MSFPETLRAILDLWWDGVLASFLVALVLPLVGALVFLRRQVFLGVAVPEFATAGLALGLWILPWFPTLYESHLDHGHPPMPYALAFAAAGASLALAAFAWLESRDRTGSSEGRLAAGYALATALALIFLSLAPVGDSYVEGLLEGERILLIDHHDLFAVAAVQGTVFLLLAIFRRGLLLLAFDADGAVAQGLKPARYERIQSIAVGLAVGGGVMTVGPVLVFGLLFLPPLIARQVAGNLRVFLAVTVLSGVVAVAVAWPLSVALDLPFGPMTVASASLLLLPARVLGRLRPPGGSSC